MEKVKFTNRHLWKQYLVIVSAVFAIITNVLAFIDFEQSTRLYIATSSIIVLIIVFLVMWFLANRTTEKVLNINTTKVTIKFGDIFRQEGFKVIAFNEYFDTQVDNRIISEKTLNGIFIKHHSSGANSIDNIIDNEQQIIRNILAQNVSRPNGGKTTKYKLGTICPLNNEYLLLAFSHFDDENRAYTSVEDYVSCLMHMWNELDIYYAGKPISITLLGSGITRFHDSVLSPQELLKIMIMTYKASKVKFNNTSSLSIILGNNVKDKINLYDIVDE